jgi:hypothetical protein
MNERPPGYDPRGDTPEDRAWRGAAAEEAVGGLVQQIDPGAMATKFVLLVETVDGDGVRALWALTPDELAAWESVGMLTHALHREQAAVLDDGD